MATAGDPNPPDPGKKVATSSREGGVDVPDHSGSQQDHLITEIESSDGHLGSTLRAVYDGDESAEFFMDKLDNRIKSHDKEIERMCNYHYQGFIESIRGLLKVRSDVETLKSDIKTTNDELQQSSQSLVSKAEELVKCRKIQRNIASAVETLSVCLPVLEMYGKLREQMKNKRYYPALKTLEQLEHTYLPRVSKYRFSQAMCAAIPKLRESIKEASMSDLKDFLENIRKHSERIGEVAMKHAAEQNSMDPKIASKRPKKRKAPPPPNPFGDTPAKPVDPDDELNPFAEPSNPFAEPVNPFDEEEEDEISLVEDPSDTDETEGLSAQDLIDFSPVYRCLHIYSVLGARECFESYYRKQRKKQARLALQPPPNMSLHRRGWKQEKDRARRITAKEGVDPNPHETLEGYKKYFHEVIGFFVVEDHILNTTPGLVNRSYMDQLWEMALTKIVATLRIHTTFCTDPSLMLNIKNLIMLFCHTLNGYGFPVSQLYDLLLELRDQYSALLMKKWVSVFNTIFDEDNYTPITVTTEREYRQVTDVYPFRDTKREETSFPKSFPFSQFVPRIYCQVKEYIYACLKFSEDLHLSQTEIDDMIRKLANVLLTQTLSDCLSALIKQPNLSLLQLIQISINMNYLEKSCSYLEDFITNLSYNEQDNLHVSRLQGTSMFKDARQEAEEQIYKQINKKINEFLELANYEWMIEESKGHASEYITSLIMFLQSVFLSFTNLPTKVAQTACLLACKHIARSLMDMLLDTEVKSLSLGALQQYNLDLVQCEQFAASEPVPGFNDGTLMLAFMDLRQLLDLFLSWDWTTYLADYGKDTSRYLRVSPNTCIIMLEKLKETDKKKNTILTSFKRNERDKKKLMETVLRQLRQLVNGQNCGGIGEAFLE